MSHVLEVDGLGSVEIENWDEFKEKVLKAIGFQVVPEIQKQIKMMSLLDSTDFWQSIDSEVVNGELIIFSTVPWAVFLEYGTFDYWNSFGEESFPTPGYPSIPKKKELTSEQRKQLPKGMQPFAPFRRVLWNPNKMNITLQKAFNAASK